MTSQSQGPMDRMLPECSLSPQKTEYPLPPGLSTPWQPQIRGCLMRSDSAPTDTASI